MVKKNVKIIIILVIISTCLSILLYSREGPILQGEAPPEFSFTLVDNGDNDLVEMRYISTGRGFFSGPNPFPLRGTAIHIRPKDNTLQLYEVKLPPENLFLNENMKVYLNDDVFNTGESYLVYIVYIEYVPDILSYAVSLPYEVVAR
jgi:hypothetical protein